MKERGILFSSPMVIAILQGRKTQTRRVVTLPKWAEPGQEYEFEIDDKPGQGQSAIDWPFAIAKKSGCLAAMKCPYGEPGDRLWVRETWNQVHPCQVSEGRFSLKGRAGIPGPPPVDYRVIYKADGGYPSLHNQEDYPYRFACEPYCSLEHAQEYGNLWIPSMFMPRWASRILLEVQRVTIEPLQSITEQDAIAEGMHATIRNNSWKQSDSAREAFMALWDSINAKRAGGKYAWEKNPIVWKVQFKKP